MYYVATLFSHFAAKFFPCPPMATKRKQRSALPLLAALDMQERKSLLEFLQSPYCTSLPPRNDCYTMVQAVFELKDNQLDASDEHLFAAVFPEELYEKGRHRFNHLMSDLYQLIRKFIQVEILAREWSDREQELSLLRFYKEKGLENKFWATRENLKEAQQQRQLWTGKDYYWNFLVEQEESEFLSARNDRKDDLNLLDTLHALDEFYLLERSYLTCNLLNQNQLAPLALQSLHDLLVFNPDSEQLRWFFGSPIGSLLRNAMIFLSEDPSKSQRTFEEYHAVLLQEEHNLHPEYLKNFEMCVYNYYIRQCNLGHHKYLQPLLDLSRHRLKAGRIYQDGHIQAGEFQSIVNIGLRLREFEWVHQFIKDHQRKIAGSDNPEDTYNFSLANYYFHTRQYGQAMRILVQANYKEMQHKLSSKTLEIKILYEERQYDLLDSKLNAVKKFLSVEKDKIPANRQSNYCSFANIIIRILRPDTAIEQKRAEGLYTDIKNNKTIAERIWLLEKMEEILARWIKK